MNLGGFASLITRGREERRLILQPRMGFASPKRMRSGLAAVKGVSESTAGTLTLDSYTRTGDYATAELAVSEGRDLNGYPLVAHGAAVTRQMLTGIVDDSFAVQVRHGSPHPLPIFWALLDAGLDATEGGPVSYCLPYSRAPLANAIAEWRACCSLLAERTSADRPGHLETFGGCMLGQLCPPALLVALSVLEALFFREHGVRSVSLSYAQQTSHAQDVAAVTALRRLAGAFLHDIDWHVVIYTYMGVFPRTPSGARELLRNSVILALATGSERLIVKTESEGFKIPSVAENVSALRLAASVRDHPGEVAPWAHLDLGLGEDEDVMVDAAALVEAVLELDPDIGRALAVAFRRGILDVPFCLHPDNANRARSYIDRTGRLRWADVGSMPLSSAGRRTGSRSPSVGAGELLDMLAYNQRRFDDPIGAA